MKQQIIWFVGGNSYRYLSNYFVVANSWAQLFFSMQIVKNY